MTAPDTDRLTETLAEVWAVIDIGCHECRVRSEPVGLFASKTEAAIAAAARDQQTQMWRDGGQTFALTFRLDAAALRPTIDALLTEQAERIAAAIIDTATKVPITDYDTGYGDGLIDASNIAREQGRA